MDLSIVPEGVADIQPILIIDYAVEILTRVLVRKLYPIPFTFQTERRYTKNKSIQNCVKTNCTLWTKQAEKDV